MSQRPLRLKSEKVSSKPRVTPHTQFVEVCVDTGVAHLDSPYTYAFNPDEVSFKLACGTYVEVPFNNRMVRGFVLRSAPEIVNPKLGATLRNHFTEEQNIRLANSLINILEHYPTQGQVDLDF